MARKVLQIALQTDKGETVFSLKELSGPAILRLSGPLARAINKLKPAFMKARGEGSDLVSAVLEGLSNLDDKDFQLIQESLFKGHVTARMPDGTEDLRAGERIDEYFTANQVDSYLKLLWEAFALSYAQLFQVVQQNLNLDLNSALNNAAAAKSVPQ